MNETCQECRYRDKRSGVCMNLMSDKCGSTVMSFEKCDQWKGGDYGSEQQKDEL